MPDAQCRILDAHTHAFPDALAPRAIENLTVGAKWFEIAASFDGTVRGLLASTDRAGIARAIVCSVATRPEQAPKITEWSARIASARIVPFGSVHPDSPAPEAEVEQAAAAGLRGLKFHPYFMNCPLDDPRTIRIARAAARAGLAMTCHAGYDFGYDRDERASPAALRRLHEAVPDLRLAGCHLGGWERWAEVLAEVAGLPIYLETSFTLGRCPEDLLLAIMEKHGLHHILFGTDAPWADQAAEVAKLRALPLAEPEKQAILWENGLRFLAMNA